MVNKKTNIAGHKIIISWKEFRDLVKELDKKIVKRKDWSRISGIYGIPRGGQYVALMLSEISGIPMASEITKHVIVVDDIVDSGSTLTKYHGKGVATAALFVKPHSSIKPHFWVRETKDWVVFPYEAAKDAGDSENE